MKKSIIFLFLLILLSTQIEAFSCQYQENITENRRELVFYEDGERLDYKLLEVRNFQQGRYSPIYVNSNVQTTFDVYNNHLTKSILVKVLFMRNYSQDNETVEIGPLSYVNIGGRGYDQIDSNSIRFDILTEGFTAQIEDVEHVINQTCRLCNGKTCINDGDPCKYSSECGGSYCIEWYCSNENKCYQNNCRCSEGKTQCTDNKTCVEKNVVLDGAKPKCNLAEECKTNFLDKGTGLCASSPSQKQEDLQRRKNEAEAIRIKQIEEGYDLIKVIVVVLVLALVVFLVYKFKIKGQETEQLREKVKKAQADVNKIKYEILEQDKEIEELKEKKKKTAQEVKELVELNITKDGMLKELDEKNMFLKSRSKEYYLNLYETRFHKRIEVDTKGYFVFKDSKRPLHRWVYESNYQPIKEGNLIHHIDTNHFNNEIWNLVEVSEQTHNKIKHGRIEFGNWNSGINALKQAGIKEDDFPEHVKEHLRKQSNYKKE